MRTVYASRSGGSLYLGKRGTNDTTRVLFPLEEGMDEIVVLHQRAGDEHPYAVPVRITDDGVEWIVSLADTAVVAAETAAREAADYRLSESITEIFEKTDLFNSIDTVYDIRANLKNVCSFSDDTLTIPNGVIIGSKPYNSMTVV